MGLRKLIGPNQKIVQQPSIASRSMTNMISEPSKDIELAQTRQERKKEQYLLAAEFTPKVDPILSTSDKNGMQSVPSNPAVISSLQSVSSSKQPQLTPSVVNHTISRIDSSSKRLDHSPKSRQNTHASALLTAMDYSSEGVKQIPLAQVKETAEKTSHSMDAKHEHGTPSSLPPPPSTLMANRYPNLGRKESSSLPPPLAANIHPGQPSGESLDDTRPVVGLIWHSFWNDIRTKMPSVQSTACCSAGRITTQQICPSLCVVAALQWAIYTAFTYVFQSERQPSAKFSCLRTRACSNGTPFTEPRQPLEHIE